MGPSAEMEITALGELTKAGGSCTPTLHAWKHEKQGTQMWIPGGFIVYILMEKLPGMRLDDIWSLERKERYEVRKSFKEAWGYVASPLEIFIYWCLFFFPGNAELAE